MRLDLTNADAFTIKGTTRYSCFLGNVNMTGLLLYKLLINFEMYLSMNLLEYLSDKSISLRFSVSKWNLDLSETKQKQQCNYV